MVVGCNLRSMALRAVQQKKGACDRGKIRRPTPTPGTRGRPVGEGSAHLASPGHKRVFAVYSA